MIWPTFLIDLILGVLIVPYSTQSQRRPGNLYELSQGSALRPLRSLFEIPTSLVIFKIFDSILLFHIQCFHITKAQNIVGFINTCLIPLLKSCFYFVVILLHLNCSR